MADIAYTRIQLIGLQWIDIETCNVISSGHKSQRQRETNIAEPDNADVCPGIIEFLYQGRLYRIQFGVTDLGLDDENGTDKRLNIKPVPQEKWIQNAIKGTSTADDLIDFFENTGIAIDSM